VQLQTTGFALFGMYVLFILRKFIFWLNILLVQKVDLERWIKEEKIENEVESVAEGSNFKRMKGLFDNISVLQNAMESIQNIHPKEAEQLIIDTKDSESLEKPA